jgi:hypothetical protein
MKASRHPVQATNDDIVGQHSIPRTKEIRQRMLPVRGKSDYLAKGVDTSIGTPSTYDTNGFLGDPLQGLLQHALDRAQPKRRAATRALNLKPAKVCTIIGHNGPQV